MADVSIKYKGNEIGTMDASGTKTLLTSGKYCEDDITLQYVKPAAYVKLAEQEFTLNTTSTSVSIIGTITIPTASDLWTSANYIMITVRDKAGKRAGYFVGADAIFSNVSAANGTGTSMSNPARIGYTYSSSNVFAISAGNYGVYAYDISSSGNVRIATRYNSTSSLTINGTYVVTVWALAFAPNTNPFV